jgi:hypothetical protein
LDPTLPRPAMHRPKRVAAASQRPFQFSFFIQIVALR